MSRIRANQITNQSADGAPTVQHGLIIAGVSTFTGSVSIGGTLTYEDVTNIDSVGIVTARGGIHIDDSIVHIGDTNTKIRFPSADTISFETAGSERLRIDSSGRVLIGHTSSQDVYATSKLQIQGTTAATSSLSLLRHGNSPYLTLGSSGGSSLGAVDALSSGDRIGQITFAGADGTDINTHGASIAAYVDGSVTSNNVPARIVFATGSSETERARIDSSGYVMIGNTAAAAQYSKDLVVGNASGEHGITIISQSNSIGRLLFSDSLSSGAATYQGQVNYNHSADELILATYTLGQIVMKTSNAERLRIGHDGTVSVTTSAISAIAKFQLYGSGNASDALADNLRFHHWGNSSGEYWDIGVNHGLNGSGNNSKPSTTLKGAGIRLNGKNGSVTLITSPSSTSTQYEGLTQNENGYVTIPHQPSFHARYINNASATQNPLVYDSVHHNNGSHYKSSGTDQGKFVAPVSGVYLFYWTAIKTSSGSVTRLYINVDGSHIYSNMHLRLQEQGNYSNGSMQAIVNLNAGQKVHISLEVGSIHGNEYTHFGGYLIH